MLRFLLIACGIRVWWCLEGFISSQVNGSELRFGVILKPCMLLLESIGKLGGIGGGGNESGVELCGVDAGTGYLGVDEGFGGGKRGLGGCCVDVCNYALDRLHARLHIGDGYSAAEIEADREEGGVARETGRYYLQGRES